MDIPPDDGDIRADISVSKVVLVLFVREDGLSWKLQGVVHSAFPQDAYDVVLPGGNAHLGRVFGRFKQLLAGMEQFQVREGTQNIHVECNPEPLAGQSLLYFRYPPVVCFHIFRIPARQIENEGYLQEDAPVHVFDHVVHGNFYVLESIPLIHLFQGKIGGSFKAYEEAVHIPV